MRVIHLERVAQAKREVIADADVNQLSMTYKIMGDPTRLKIIIALKGGEMCVCDMAAFLGLSESAVSHQLRRLRDRLLVSSRRVGQVLYYRLTDRHVQDLVDIGLTHIRE